MAFFNSAKPATLFFITPDGRSTAATAKDQLKRNLS